MQPHNNLDKAEMPDQTKQPDYSRDVRCFHEPAEQQKSQASERDQEHEFPIFRAIPGAPVLPNKTRLLQMQ